MGVERGSPGMAAVRIGLVVVVVLEVPGFDDSDFEASATSEDFASSV